MIKPRAIHIIDASEYHMISDKVAVVWSLRTTVDHLREERDGLTWTATRETQTRSDATPWVELVWIRADNRGVPYIEDSPETCFTVMQAMAVAEAIRQAVQYIQEQTNA